jgi:signal transduction histidine kinase
MEWHRSPRVPIETALLAPQSCGRRRRRRAALLFEIVRSITRSFDHVLAGALGECHRLDTTPLIDPEISRSIERIQERLLESSSAARRLCGLTDTADVGHADAAATTDLDATLREFITVARPLCRADGRRRGARIRVRARLESGARVASSAERLRELATGLLSQAIDALPSGGVVDVETADSECGPWLEVRYADAHAPVVTVARPVAADEVATESVTHASTTLRVRLHRVEGVDAVGGYSEPAPRAAASPLTSLSKPM